MKLHFVPGLARHWILCVVLALAELGCSSLPDVKHKTYTFPPQASYGVPRRPFKKLGLVRAKATYVSMGPDDSEERLCFNYHNKAVQDLVKFAKDQGGDGVIEVRSVVFLLDGKSELHPKPECVDDGEGAEALAQGIAVKYLPEGTPTVTPTPTAVPAPTTVLTPAAVPTPSNSL